MSQSTPLPVQTFPRLAHLSLERMELLPRPMACIAGLTRLTALHLQ